MLNGPPESRWISPSLSSTSRCTLLETLCFDFTLEQGSQIGVTRDFCLGMMPLLMLTSLLRSASSRRPIRRCRSSMASSLNIRMVFEALMFLLNEHSNFGCGLPDAEDVDVVYLGSTSSKLAGLEDVAVVTKKYDSESFRSCLAG